MPRPPKWRRVGSVPEVTYFKPAGVPLASLAEVCLSVEEAEAIRLRDVESLEQEDCAKRMQISRPTFHRILGSARRKLADALLHGKAIRIEGGNFELAMSRFQCGHDGYEWEVPFETMISSPPEECPVCHSVDIRPLGGCGMGRRRRRRGRGGQA